MGSIYVSCAGFRHSGNDDGGLAGGQGVGRAPSRAAQGALTQRAAPAPGAAVPQRSLRPAAHLRQQHLRQTGAVSLQALNFPVWCCHLLRAVWSGACTSWDLWVTCEKGLDSATSAFDEQTDRGYKEAHTAICK